MTDIEALLSGVLLGFTIAIILMQMADGMGRR